jgi:glycosyltransferase involved in cell wall biosynthesis
MRNTLAALRVLVVLPHPPLPEGSAAARCGIGLVRGLIACGVQAQALAANLGSAPLDTVPADLPVEVIPVEVPSTWQARRDRLLRPNGLLRRGPFAARLKELARQVDIVHFVEPQSAVTMPLVDRPSLVQIHFLTQRDRKIGWPWRRDTRIAIELLRAERSVCRSARWLLANSREVAAELARTAPHAHVGVAPLALDPSFYVPRASAESQAVGLIGTARWPPTKHAVERLLSDVWPLVREQRPQARLLLAGRGMERAAFSHLPECTDVQWRGEVPNATDFLRELGVVLYPLTDGSGAKVKVLEALALGIPVVTTPDGAEGLGGLGGVTVDTDDRRLAAATLSLLEHPQGRAAAAEAAHRTFVEHHTPQVAARPVVKLYERIAASEA